MTAQEWLLIIGGLVTLISALAAAAVTVIKALHENTAVTAQAVKVDLAAMKAKAGAAPSVAVSPAPTPQPETSGPPPIVLERG